MSEKRFITYNDIHKLCADTAHRIIDAGFKPDVIVAIGGGGYIPARILRTFLKAPIKSVSLELYNDETDKPGDTVIVKQWLSREDVAGKNILVVDEVDDTRQTLYTCVQKLREYSPKEIGTYVVFNKTTNKVVGQHWDDESATKTDVNVEHYWPAQNVPGTWLVFPWEAVDIDEHDKNSN